MKNTKRRSRAATYTQSVSQSESVVFIFKLSTTKVTKYNNIFVKKKTPSLYTKVTKFKKSESSFSL